MEIECCVCGERADHAVKHMRRGEWENEWILSPESLCKSFFSRPSPASQQLHQRRSDPEDTSRRCTLTANSVVVADATPAKENHVCAAAQQSKARAGEKGIDLMRCSLIDFICAFLSPSPSLLLVSSHHILSASSLTRAQIQVSISQRYC